MVCSHTCLWPGHPPQLSSMMAEQYLDRKPSKESCVLQNGKLVIQLEVLFSNESMSRARADVNPEILLVGSEQRCKALYARAEVVIQISWPRSIWGNCILPGSCFQPIPVRYIAIASCAAAVCGWQYFSHVQSNSCHCSGLAPFEPSLKDSVLEQGLGGAFSIYVYLHLHMLHLLELVFLISSPKRQPLCLAGTVSRQDFSWDASAGVIEHKLSVCPQDCFKGWSPSRGVWPCLPAPRHWQAVCPLCSAPSSAHSWAVLRWCCRVVRLGSRDCLSAASAHHACSQGKVRADLGEADTSWFSGAALHEDLAPTKCDLQCSAVKALGAWGGDLNNIFVMVLAGLSEISIKQLSCSPFPVAWETLRRWICLGLFGLLGGVSLQQWSLILPALALCLHGVA